MKLSTGAGGFAAAMLLLLTGMLNPTPSRAWQMNLPNVAPAAPAAAAPGQAAPADPAIVPAIVSLPAPASVLPAQPVIAPAPVPAPAVEGKLAGAVATAEENCLATAVYFEAKGEPLRGQKAVAEVILNRTRSGRFPASVCGVVKQRGQFSFVHGGRLPGVPHGAAAWRTALSVARDVLDGTGERVASNALFFHARSVSTGWHAVRVAQIGHQVFYR